VAHLPPVSTLFAALLGYNPIHNLLDPTGVLNHLSAKQVGVLTGKQFFPSVISGPFHHGLVIVFTAAAIMSFIGAMVSLLRGKQFYYDDSGSGSGAGQVAAATAAPAPAVPAPAPAVPAQAVPAQAVPAPAVPAPAVPAVLAELPGQAEQVSRARRGTEPNGTPREAANSPAVTAGTSRTANGLAVTAGTSGTASGTSGNGHGTNGRANRAGANRAGANGTGTNGSAARAQANGDSRPTTDDDAATGSSRGQRQ
jgi:hypothetical protein